MGVGPVVYMAADGVGIDLDGGGGALPVATTTAVAGNYL